MKPYRVKPHYRLWDIVWVAHWWDEPLTYFETSGEALDFCVAHAKERFLAVARAS